jgi:hypothetical protein
MKKNKICSNAWKLGALTKVLCCCGMDSIECIGGMMQKIVGL